MYNLIPHSHLNLKLSISHSLKSKTHIDNMWDVTFLLLKSGKTKAVGYLQVVCTGWECAGRFYCHCYWRLLQSYPGVVARDSHSFQCPKGENLHISLAFRQLNKRKQNKINTFLYPEPASSLSRMLSRITCLLDVKAWRTVESISFTWTQNSQCSVARLLSTMIYKRYLLLLHYMTL